MYLSRLRLDIGRGATRETDELLQDLYKLHQAVFAAFDGEERGEGGVLFRCEPEVRNGCVTVLVQSRLEPNWGRGFAARLCATAAPEVRLLSLRLRRGQRLRFRLRANPTRRSRDGRRRSVLSGLGRGAACDVAYKHAVLRELAARGEEDPPPVRFREYVLERWLHRQLAGAVADLEFQITDEGLLRGWKPVKKVNGLGPSEQEAQSHLPIEFKSVRYDGVLEVGDPDVLLRKMVCGIGAGKAFGFGLLSVAPAR